MKDRSFVLIFGSARSGTTLVREILNKHSKVNIIPETGFYDRLWAARHWLGPVGCRDSWVRWLYYVLYQSYDPAMVHYRSSLQVLVEEFNSEPPRDPDDLFVRISEMLCRNKGKYIAGEKTPNHLKYWKRILKGIPGARIIITMRDPRAVTASTLKRGDLADKAWKSAVEWRISAEFTKEIVNWDSDGKVLVITYEELVNNSRSVIEQICRHVGVEFEESMQQGISSNSSYQSGEKAGIFSTSIDRWREILTDQEIGVVDRIAGAYLEDFDYKRMINITQNRLKFKELMFYWRLRTELLLGNLGIRPNRAYLNHLRCRFKLVKK